MSVDILQEKIRKMKNPSMLELALSLSDLPPQYEQTAAGYGAFCRELLEGLKDTVPAVRISFAMFALLGADGMAELTKTLTYASELGYYVCLDAPEVSLPPWRKSLPMRCWGREARIPVTA